VRDWVVTISESDFGWDADVTGSDGRQLGGAYGYTFAELVRNVGQILTEHEVNSRPARD
jgi:hypothetical protein